VTLWESVWRDVANEIPRSNPRPKSWGGFFGALLAAIVPIPSDLDNLHGIRWRDRLRREIARMRGRALSDMRRACVASLDASAAALPRHIEHHIFCVERTERREVGVVQDHHRDLVSDPSHPRASESDRPLGETGS